MKMEESHKGKQFLGEAEEQLSQSNLQLSPTCNSLKKSHLRFYYLDLLEGVKPGQLYLFGKIYLPLTKIYASCCVTVTIPRRLYLLPISQSSQSMKAVIAEFNKHVMKHGIKKQDYTMQLQRKKYAFDIEDIPTVANYLTVTYPASYPVMLHSDHSQIIKHIFGASLNSLELFLSEREIKGPSWLQIQDSEFVELKKNETRCHYQVSCPSMNNITVVREKLGIPPMVLTELNIKSAPINGVEQVMMIHMSIMKSFNIFEMSTHDQKPTIVDEYCFIRGPVNSLSLPHLTNDGFSFSTATCPSINVVTCNGEKNLLDTFVDKFQCYDPDIIVGYQCENSLENLLNRLQHYNKACPQTKISRIKMDGWNISCNKLRKQSNLRCVIGRPICDVRLAVNEIYPKLATLCNVDLICAELLNTNVGTIKQIASFQVLECYSSIEQIVEFINNTRLESQSIIKLVYHMNIIPLVMEVTAITGHVLSQSFTFPKNMRNEFLLIHAFHKRGYIIPDRRIINVKDKKTFSGGRVLEVIARMHVDTTLLMDFKSLYPNIIREYNICFTTMPGVCFKSFDEIYVQLNAPMGIIPKLVGDIVEARSKAKCHMNTPNISLAEKAKYQAQQLALKLIANTLYGSFGSIYFRFYARNIAAKITAKGREILMNAVTMAKSNTFSTIYGDTDSLIIDTMQRDPTEARRIAGVIKNVVNQQYQFIELELEAIYKYIIIVNRKQYTGLSLIDLPDGKSQLVLEGKGTLPKKGSNCQLVISIVEHVTKQMFNDELYPKRRKKVAEYLQKLAKEANENPSQFENDLVITQKVGSHSNLWLSCKSNHEKLPHDNTDNKTNKDGSNCKSDESISYIIRSDGTSRSPEERAYLQTDGKQFPPDINYYFISQLIPRLQNVFRPMDDLSSSFFAKHLGLKDQYNTIPGVEPVANEEQHKSIKVCPLAEPVTITCRKCGVAQSMNGFIREGQEGRDSVPFLSACLNDECDCAPWRYVDGILEDLDYAIANFLEEHPPKVRCAYIKYKKGSSEYIEFRCNYIVDNIDEIPATCPTCNHSSKFAVDLPAPLVYARIRQLREFFNVNAQSNLVKESLTKEVTDAYIFLWHALDRLINRRRMSVINMKKLHRRHE